MGAQRRPRGHTPLKTNRHTRGMDTSQARAQRMKTRHLLKYFKVRAQAHFTVKTTIHSEHNRPHASGSPPHSASDCNHQTPLLTGTTRLAGGLPRLLRRRLRQGGRPLPCHRRTRIWAGSRSLIFISRSATAFYLYAFQKDSEGWRGQRSTGRGATEEGETVSLEERTQINPNA